MEPTLQDVGLAVKRVQNRHHRTLDTRLTELGVSLAQWDALRHLAANPEASLHALAQLTFQTDQSFGALAGRMVERGLIERVPGPGRALRHRLTERGTQLLRAGDQVVDAVLAESFAPLSKAELATLHGLLMRVLPAATG
ncbi:MarR family winged helix-turn-helix transcriptional regulator [Kutzneria albida]|uniref:HTH marR-type domain-containing protein n=1 Tax=Kutzneria albida DSM 43870 TaxID=1449976 RepID=W5W7M1_9PSEU|nr:MarR family transcriptional regulator [Kutzneria albida]AHH96715.1 hypothetical protein KALB_3348 [Kutzneria albida DSM 43870]